MGHRKEEKGITIMNTIMTPMLAMHAHVAGRGFLLLVVVVAAIVVIACWPSKTESK